MQHICDTFDLEMMSTISDFRSLLISNASACSFWIFYESVRLNFPRDRIAILNINLLDSQKCSSFFSSSFHSSDFSAFVEECVSVCANDIKANKNQIDHLIDAIPCAHNKHTQKQQNDKATLTIFWRQQKNGKNKAEHTRKISFKQKSRARETIAQSQANVGGKERLTANTVKCDTEENKAAQSIRTHTSTHTLIHNQNDD